MKHPAIFHALVLSFHSRDLYREVARGWRGRAFLYLLVLLAVCWIPVTISMYVGLSEFLEEYAPALVQQMPRVTITDGKVSTDADEPHYIRDPESGKVFAIIDTTGQVTSLDGTEALVLLTEDRVFVREGEEGEPLRETTVYDLSGVQSFSIDRQTVDVWLKRLAGWGPVVILPFLVVGSYAYRIVQALVYAAIGLLVNLVAGTSLRYPAILGIAMVAVTPAIVLKTLMTVTGIDLPVAWLIYFAVAMGYLYFGISSCRVPDEPEAGTDHPDA